MVKKTVRVEDRELTYYGKFLDFKHNAFCRVASSQQKVARRFVIDEGRAPVTWRCKTCGMVIEHLDLKPGPYWWWDAPWESIYGGGRSDAEDL